MPDARVVEWIREKDIDLAVELDERGRRRWTAIEARSLGRGGIAAVAEATGISDRTIRTGMRELAAGNSLPPYRQRREGAGRRSRQEEQPELVTALEEVISPPTRGDPPNPLRWTCKSTRIRAAELRNQGFEVGASTVRELLRELGYSLQGKRKTREGTQHPDRNAQFEQINARVRARKRRGEPAISVDPKKKEKLGNKSKSGREYEPQGHPRETDTHDFLEQKKGKVVPYGVYAIHRNEAVVAIGISPDTAEFAVAAIRLWWTKLGKDQYASSQRLLITADSGGSKAVRSRLCKLELHRLAEETGLLIEVCPYPPGTSKWNKIEHRLFCHITRNWRGVPLETREIVVSSIGNTRTTTGLEVQAWLDEKLYKKGSKVPAKEFSACTIKRNKFHGDWNYTIHPRKST
jgi:transposase